jgi:hypothetical protein
MYHLSHEDLLRINIGAAIVFLAAIFAIPRWRLLSYLTIEIGSAVMAYVYWERVWLSFAIYTVFALYWLRKVRREVDKRVTAKLASVMAPPPVIAVRTDRPKTEPDVHTDISYSIKKLGR